MSVFLSGYALSSFRFNFLESLGGSQRLVASLAGGIPGPQRVRHVRDAGRIPMTTFSWQILDSILYNGGRLALVARKTRQGSLVQAGLTFEPTMSESFPKLIHGGTFPGNWKSSKEIVRIVRERREEMKQDSSVQVESLQEMFDLFSSAYQKGEEVSVDQVEAADRVYAMHHVINPGADDDLWNEEKQRYEL